MLNEQEDESITNKHLAMTMNDLRNIKQKTHRTENGLDVIRNAKITIDAKTTKNK